jgi:hypothetical protein
LIERFGRCRQDHPKPVQKAAARTRRVLSPRLRRIKLPGKIARQSKKRTAFVRDFPTSRLSPRWSRAILPRHRSRPNGRPSFGPVGQSHRPTQDPAQSFTPLGLPPALGIYRQTAADVADSIRIHDSRVGLRRHLGCQQPNFLLPGPFQQPPAPPRLTARPPPNLDKSLFSSEVYPANLVRAAAANPTKPPTNQILRHIARSSCPVVVTWCSGIWV